MDEPSFNENEKQEIQFLTKFNVNLKNKTSDSFVEEYFEKVSNKISDIESNLSNFTDICEMKNKFSNISRSSPKNHTSTEEDEFEDTYFETVENQLDDLEKKIHEKSPCVKKQARLLEVFEKDESIPSSQEFQLSKRLIEQKISNMEEFLFSGNFI